MEAILFPVLLPPAPHESRLANRRRRVSSLALVSHDTKRLIIRVAEQLTIHAAERLIIRVAERQPDRRAWRAAQAGSLR